LLSRVQDAKRLSLIFSLDLPHVFNRSSSRDENAAALRILLDCLIALNCAYLAEHNAAPLYQSGVRYRRTNTWSTLPALYERGYGDCKSLTAALVAERRAQGLQASPVFRWIPNSTGGISYHILVMTPTGFEDPSRALGMGRDETGMLAAGDY
jgi:hypothetical protein